MLIGICMLLAFAFALRGILPLFVNRGTLEQELPGLFNLPAFWNSIKW